MERKIHVLSKNVWGRLVFYPINDFAQFMTKVVGTKSLNEHVLRVLKEEGIEITYEGEKSVFLDSLNATKQ